MRIHSLRGMALASAFLLCGCGSDTQTSGKQEQIIERLINNEVRSPDGSSVFTENQQTAFIECARPKIEGVLAQISENEITDLMEAMPKDSYETSDNPIVMRAADAYGECLSLLPFPGPQ